MSNDPKICFFARVPDREILEYNQFYAQDIRILRSITSRVDIAIRWDEIPTDCDLYFVWWWQWAFLPMARSAFRRRPIIVTGVVDVDDPMPGAWATWPRWKKGIVQAALRLATANVFVSQLEYQRVPSMMTTRNPQYAPLVVDAEAHPYEGGPREPFLLTVAGLNGRNPERKGVDLAIKAHAKLRAQYPELKLVVAGGGDATERLQALARDLGTSSHVEFAGRVDHAEKVRLLQRCSAYLQPSVFEGFGVAAAEAMACGAPVVACRTGTLPEVLGEDAFYATGRTPEEVAAATERAIRDGVPELTARASGRVTSRFAFEVRRAAVSAIASAALGKA